MSEMSLAWELWGNLPRVRPYIRPYKWLGALSVSLTILASGAALLQPWPLAIMLNTVTGKSTIFTRLGIDNKTTVVVIAVTAGFLLTVATHALTVWNSYIDTKLEQRVILDLRARLSVSGKGLGEQAELVPHPPLVKVFRREAFG